MESAGTVVTGAPPHVLAKVAIMFAGLSARDPEGKLEPVTFTLLTPATPLLGAVHAASFT
jgi:hypothetical protein